MTDSRTLYIHTIGCQMNVYDGEQIERMLAGRGYRPVAGPESADLVVVNTCAIREKAEQKVFSFLGRLARLKRERPGMMVAVGGCVAQQEGEKIRKRAPCVDVIFGTRSINALPGLLDAAEVTGRPQAELAMSPGEAAFVTARPPEAGAGPASAFVTIMQGCDNFCAYCVVPRVRGREVSKPPESTLAEIENLVAAGVREVTLLGQNVNAYCGGAGGCDFPELLARVNAVEGLRRIRFTTSHPKDLSEGLMAAFGRLDKLCHHIHLPVQSGSDAVLARMNRKYSRQIYMDRVAALRDHCPDIAITSDFIVGFPGESEADFEQTLSLMDAVRFDGVFAFNYSDRPGAPAARFRNKVDPAASSRRLERLLNFQKTVTTEKHAAMVGKVVEVLVDGPARKSAPQFTGRTFGNAIVNFTPEPADRMDQMDLMDRTDLMDQFRPGRRVRVLIEAAFAHSLRGKPEPREAKGEKSHAA